MSAAQQVVIVGGGIAGLVAAYRLREQSPDTQVILVEQEPRLGGKILTEHVSGFVIEGGPDSFLSSKPWGLELCRQLGIEDRLQGTNEAMRRTFVLSGGRLHDLPEGLTGLVPSRLEPLMESTLFSPHGKERIAREPAIPPRPDGGDESLASFAARRFGREAYERLIEPLMSGIYAGDGEQLSLEATFPQLRELELAHGSLIKGIQASGASKAPAEQRTRPGFLTPVSGMGEIVQALVSRLAGIERVTGSARSLSQSPTGYVITLEGGERIHAESVILATPAFASADLVAGLDLALAAALAAIPYVSTATVSVAYPREAVPGPLEGYGYIVPRSEGREVLACTWVSSKFDHRAPPGYALLRAFVGRAGREQALEGTDADLLEIVRAELRQVLGIEAPPALYRIYRWPKAMPQYTLGHRQRLETIEARLAEQPGLLAVGSAYRGVGIPDCIHSGAAAATAVMAHLGAAMLSPSPQTRTGEPREEALRFDAGGPDRI